MTDPLDQLLARLAAEPTDRSLAHLEARVGRSIADRRTEAHAGAALIPVRLASIGLAMAIGLVAGGATSGLVTGHNHGLFAPAADLAPSTLLDGGR
jgi:hypothetical protein